MARYIDVDKLIAEYDRVHIGVAGGARKLMVEAPTADVVEVKHITSNEMITFTDEQIRVLETALDTYGFQNQCDILIEEMSELTKAVIKYRRYGTDKEYLDLCEEIVDVSIILQQILLATHGEHFDDIIKNKINRLAVRIDCLKGE